MTTKGNNERVTMYKLASMLSERVGTRVREQQLYNYRAKGLIKVGADGRVSVEEALAFVEKFATKREERIAKKLAEIAE